MEYSSSTRVVHLFIDDSATRVEDDSTGGPTRVGLGVRYSMVGVVTHVYATTRLAGAIGLSLAGQAHGLATALVPPAAIVTALLCFLDQPPAWVVEAGKALPRAGLWRPKRET